jgi:hypothetical protein
MDSLQDDREPRNTGATSATDMGLLNAPTSAVRVPLSLVG